MAQAFQVVFTGKLNPAANVEDAIRDFAAVFKVDEAQARALITGGQARVLKTDVDTLNAHRYQDVLDEIGLASRIEPMDAEGGVTVDVARGKPIVSGAATASRDGFGASASGSGASGPDAVESMAASATADAGPSQPTLGPIGRPASHGWLWINQAWQQFKAQPGVWLAAVALVYLVTLALSLVPVVGSLATMILGPVFAGGLMLGARSQARQGRLRVAAGFDGFSTQGGQLALVGLLYLLGLVVVFSLAGLLLMATGVMTAGSMEALSANDPELVAAVLGPGLGLVLLVLMLAMVPLLMLYWFAPALVALEGMSATRAMRMSFLGCWKNMIPFLVYAVLLLFILLGASLLLGLISVLLAAVSEALMLVLMLLMVPLMLLFAALIVLSTYSAYRDVFHAATQSQGAHVF